MNEKDLYWLAGLLEGEGSFFKPPPSEPNRPRISIQMTDEDVIQHVNRLFGLNYYKRVIDRRGAERKPSFHTIFRGQRAAMLMGSLYPLMGKRRKQQIEKAVNKNLNSEFGSLDENRFFWLVGLLEGEGSFQKSVPSKQNQPCIQLHMTDQDVIAHAASLMGVSSQGPYHRYGADEGHKPHYYTTLQGKRAVELMKQLQPHMSLRRQAQIDSVIASYHPVGQVRGERHPQAKLDADKVRDIKHRLGNGEMLTRLAREYAVDQGLIWQIKAGRIWQHIE